MQELYRQAKAAGLEVSAAVRASPAAGVDNYELSELHKYVDFINLMSYDYNGKLLRRRCMQGFGVACICTPSRHA